MTPSPWTAILASGLAYGPLASSIAYATRSVGHHRSIIMGKHPAHGLRARSNYGTSALRAIRLARYPPLVHKPGARLSPDHPREQKLLQKICASLRVYLPRLVGRQRKSAVPPSWNRTRISTHRASVGHYSTTYSTRCTAARWFGGRRGRPSPPTGLQTMDVLNPFRLPTLAQRAYLSRHVASTSPTADSPRHQIDGESENHRSLLRDRDRRHAAQLSRPEGAGDRGGDISEDQERAFRGDGARPGNRRDDRGEASAREVMRKRNGPR
jgi:hypothetical protein